MNSLQECVNEYMKEGYTRSYAVSKVCQDIIINRIHNSKYSNQITLKGGVVMFQLTQNIRRATIDIDLDFINMSIATDNIVKIFMDIGNLNNVDEFKLDIDRNKIEELSHQDYQGKRLTVTISDKFNKSFNIKLDIGVHKHINILQDALVLDTKIIDNKVSFLVNPKEQIFVEKLIPILKFGPLSTRYRDIFDLYWLITEGNLDKNLILKYMKILILDTNINIKDKQEISSIVNLVLNDKMFIQNLSNTNNWTGESIKNIVNKIKKYIKEL